MDTYAKLFKSILMSTIWQQSKETRLVWITMLVLKDARQIVEASVPGLASAAGVTLEECEEALKILKAPDEYSRSRDHDGRRIEEIEGGWRILNGEKYQQRMNEEDRREYKRIWMQNRRAIMREAKEKAAVDGRTSGVVAVLGEANRKGML